MTTNVITYAFLLLFLLIVIGLLIYNNYYRNNIEIGDWIIYYDGSRHRGTVVIIENDDIYVSENNHISVISRRSIQTI